MTGPDAETCKICGAAAAPFGAVDFNKNCSEPQGVRLPPSGILIPYLRCTACGFIYTRAFDDWTVEAFQARIYGEGYLEVDPQYVEVRPIDTANFVHGLFAEAAPRLRVLDYGGGNGRLAEELRAGGWPDVTTYDPFTPDFRERPDGRFDLVTCIETLEHMTDPQAGADDLASFLQDDGLLLFNTLIQPPNIAEIGLSWWYAGPRNGHISLFSNNALAALWGPRGFTVKSASAFRHAAYRQAPDWARQELNA